jgi:phage regulator Rha-like protein
MIDTVVREKESTALVLTATKAEARIDTRLLAQHLGSQHESLFKLVINHQVDFEELGKVRFQIGASPGSRTGQTVRFALLNEDQAYLLLTYSRNTARVRVLKVRLVKAFREARLCADTRKAEYLPTYHRMHDVIHDLASGSPNEKFVHANVNKLVNKVAGVEAGQRAKAPLPQQSILTVAQAIAAGALQGAPDHHDGYQRVKRALEAFEAMTGTLRLVVDANG